MHGFLPMHYYLTARHFPLTEAIRDHVDRHIVATVQKHTYEKMIQRIEVQLELGQRDAQYRCHVLVQLPGHHDINVTEEGLDMYAAIDLAEKRVARQLSDFRQRQATANRQPRKLDWPKVERALRTAR